MVQFSDPITLLQKEQTRKQTLMHPSSFYKLACLQCSFSDKELVEYIVHQVQKVLSKNS